MSSPTTPTVTPRRDGDPQVDLIGYRLVHRAMLADCGDLADLADRLAGGRAALTGRGAVALERYCRRLCAVIGDLHAAERQHVWPVVSAAAGSALDLADLSDDHDAVEPVLARCRSTA